MAKLYRSLVHVFEAPALLNSDVEIPFGSGSHILITASGGEFLRAVEDIHFAPVGANTQFPCVEPFRLELGKRYAIFYATTDIQDSNVATLYCEDAVDKLITFLTHVYSKQVLGRSVFRAPIIEHGKGETQNSLLLNVVAQETVSAALLISEVSKATGIISAQQHTDRFSLMSRLWVRALLEEVPEIRYLLLWIMLEVYPMVDTTNIAPIGEVLGTILGLPPQDVKTRLGLGRLAGLRADLVHHGKFNIGDSIGRQSHILEEIVRTIMRSMMGLSYDARLNGLLSCMQD